MNSDAPEDMRSTMATGDAFKAATHELRGPAITQQNVDRARKFMKHMIASDRRVMKRKIDCALAANPALQ